MIYIAKTFQGLEDVLYDELKKIGAENIKKERRAVSFEGDLALMYRANIWLRTASRILQTIATFEANDADTIYNEVKKIDWHQYISVNQTFVINSTVYSETFRNSQFVSYRTKDAIADYFNEKYGKRPSVRVTNPDIYINIHISNNICTVSLDSSGESLHKRGYRTVQTKAPINEALAAGMIMLSGWNGKSNFVDFMCGSGTLLIEAALIALNIPPGIYRKKFAFENWNNFDRELFEEIFNDESQEREFDHKIYGYDLSSKAIEIAQSNIKSAGMSKYIELKAANIADFESPQGEKCTIISNPPYGERLLDNNIIKLYNTLGQILKHRCQGIDTWIISSNIDLLKAIGLKPSKRIELLNGSLECEFWKFEIFSGKRNDFLASKSTKNK
ncbi:DNA methyltransferase [Porphyromonadaceae bacterium COT-184 OH4590]|nr:DNA methyltransferase [Porphyromonadaceae bacterium COT-184 OH4590]MDO4726198.1 RNA methyltransferase [Porphyromonadaceae bacterium]